MSQASDAGVTPLYASAPWPELPARPTSWPLLIAAVVLALTPFLVVSQVTAHLRTDVVDDQMFGYYGWRIAHGARVYLDVWDNKPPGIYWINALGMLIGRDSYGGVIGTCVAAVTVSLAAFLVASAALYHREAAALATVLAGFFLTHGFFQGATNRTETFLIACEVSAVAFYVRGFAADRWWKWLAAGVLGGAGLLFKQVGLAAWGTMGLHTIILVATRELEWRAGLRRCLLLLLGALLSIGAATGALALQGALGEAIWAVFTFNRAYFAVEDSTWFDNPKNRMLLSNHMVVLRLPLLMAAAACIHGFLWWLKPAGRPPEIEARLRAARPACPRHLLFFCIWYVVACYGAMLSPHGFAHYVLPTVPPLMFICGHLLNVLTAELGLVRRLQQRAWVAFAFVVIAYFSWDSIYWHWERVSTVYIERFERGESADWELIGDAVVRVSGPDDRLQCWGYMPGVYLRARRINACRFTTTEKIGQVGRYAERIEKELTETLMARPPEVFVITAGDYNWLHGVTPWGEIERPGVLGAWIDEHYVRVAEVRNAYVYRRKDLIAAGQSSAAAAPGAVGAAGRRRFG